MKTSQFALSILLAIGCSAHAANTASAQFSQEPVPDVIGDTFPARAGQDFARLAHAAERRPTKDAFETDQQFNARLAAFAALPVYGSVALNSRVAYIGPLSRDTMTSYGKLRYLYEPENELFRLCLPETLRERVPGVEDTVLPFIVSSSGKRLGSYIGSNAFGATARVIKAREQRLQLALITPETSSPDCFVGEPMSADEARLKTRGAAFAIVGRLRAPFLAITRGGDRATVSDPYEVERIHTDLPFDIEEVFAFDARTGVIFYRAKR